MTLDDIDRYRAAGVDLAAAAAPLGMLLAWCADQRLLADGVERDHERLLLRVRMREVGGSELIIALGGTLTEAMLTPAGKAFLEAYLPAYRADLIELFGTELPEDNPDNYGRLARHLTRRRLGPSKRSAPEGTLSRWLGRLGFRR